MDKSVQSLINTIVLSILVNLRVLQFLNTLSPPQQEYSYCEMHPRGNELCRFLSSPNNNLVVVNTRKNYQKEYHLHRKLFTGKRYQNRDLIYLGNECIVAFIGRM